MTGGSVSGTVVGTLPRGLFDRGDSHVVDRCRPTREYLGRLKL